MADGRGGRRREIDLILVLVVELDQLTHLVWILSSQIGRFTDVRRHMEQFPRLVGRNTVVDAFQRFEVANFANLPDAAFILAEQRLVGAAPQFKDLGLIQMGHRRFACQQAAQACAVDRADTRAVVVDPGTGIPVGRNADASRVGDASKIQNRRRDVDTADHRVALDAGLHAPIDVGDNHRGTNAAFGHGRFRTIERGIRYLGPAKSIGDKRTCLADIFIAVVHPSAHQEFAFQNIDRLVFPTVVRQENKDRIRVFAAGLQGFDDSASLQVEVFDHPGVDSHFLGERTLEIGDRFDLPDGVVGGGCHLFQKRCPRRIAFIVPVGHSFVALTQLHRRWDDSQLLQPGKTIGADAVPAFFQVEIDELLSNVLLWKLARLVGERDSKVEKERFLSSLCGQPFLDQLNRPIGVGSSAKVIEGHSIAADDFVVVDEVCAPARTTFASSPVVSPSFEHTERMFEALVDRPGPTRVDALAVDLAFCAQMPLADMVGVVSGISQQSGHGHHMVVEVAGVAGQPVLRCAWVFGNGSLHDAQTIDMVLDAGENLRAAGGTGRLGMVVGQLHPLGGKRIDDRCRSFAAEGAKIGIAGVICHQQHDVGSLGCCGRAFLLGVGCARRHQPEEQQSSGEERPPPEASRGDRPVRYLPGSPPSTIWIFRCHGYSPGQTYRMDKNIEKRSGLCWGRPWPDSHCVGQKAGFMAAGFRCAAG